MIESRLHQYVFFRIASIDTHTTDMNISRFPDASKNPQRPPTLIYRKTTPHFPSRSRQHLEDRMAVLAPVRRPSQSTRTTVAHRLLIQKMKSRWQRRKPYLPSRGHQRVVLKRSRRRSRRSEAIVGMINHWPRSQTQLQVRARRKSRKKRNRS